MFDYASISTITTDDILILKGLLPLAEEARKAEKMIRDTYCFHIEEDRIELWADEYNHEYLTHDGVWQARYLHQTYDVECTADSIFEYMKADYLIENGFAEKLSNDNRLTDVGKKAMIYGYFRNFLKATKRIYAVKQQ